MNPIINIAIRAARKAGTLLNRFYESTDFSYIKKKNIFYINYITKLVKNLIISIINKSYPTHNILGYKNNNIKNKSIQWIINPIDSETNFIKKFPHFSISISLIIKDITELCVIYDPIKNDMFTASRGKGAYLNGVRIRCGINKKLDNTIISSNFLFKNKKYYKIYFDLFKKIFANNICLRSTGSTSLDLSYVASGKIDGYFEMRIKPINFISGDLIVRESGGLITDFAGENNYFINGNILAGNLKIVKSLMYYTNIIKNNNY
ncbi:MAG: inositol monophosphatase family protein [Candidatus Makana argininalis]